jgi:hypothetical protein
VKQYVVRFEVIRSTEIVRVAADSFEEAVARARTAPPVFRIVPEAVREDVDGAQYEAVIGKCNWCGAEIVAHDGATTYYSDPDQSNKHICGECASHAPEYRKVCRCGHAERDHLLNGLGTPKERNSRSRGIRGRCCNMACKCEDYVRNGTRS